MLTSAGDADARAEILRSTRALIDKAEARVSEAGLCGAYGTLEDLAVGFFGSEQDLASANSSEMCERYARSLENLRLQYSQLEELLGLEAPDSRRIVQLLDAIESSATGLLEESQIASWAGFARAYAKRIGETAGEVVKTAAEAALEGAGGVVKGLGIGWTLVIVAAVVIYLNPNVLRRA
jgi:hypothetical protein